MKKASFILIVLVTLALSACVQKNLITPSQSRVGYSSWNTQVSYTHCDPLPKTGKLVQQRELLGNPPRGACLV